MAIFIQASHIDDLEYRLLFQVVLHCESFPRSIETKKMQGVEEKIHYERFRGSL